MLDMTVSPPDLLTLIIVREPLCKRRTAC